MRPRPAVPAVPALTSRPRPRCCNIANGCCLVIAGPLTIPLIILTVDVGELVSFSTWVCLVYGFFFGLLFIGYEFRHRPHGKKRDGSPKTWNDFLNEQYGFMQSFAARTAFLICLAFFMGGAGPLGWATSTFCFLHGLFNLYVYCGNASIKQEVQGGTFNATATGGDMADRVAGAAQWGAQNTDKVRAAAEKAPAAAQWAANNQDTVRAGVDLAQRNPELARNAASLAASNPDAARAAVSMASSGGTTAI